MMRHFSNSNTYQGKSIDFEIVNVNAFYVYLSNLGVVEYRGKYGIINPQPEFIKFSQG